MGKPVAFDAKAELRETRGFISMTHSSVFRIGRELDITTTCLHSNLPDAGEGSITHQLIFLIRKGHRWSNRNRITCVHS